MIEAMVSAGVLGIALIGLVNLQTNAIKGMRSARHMHEGVEMARQVLDRITVQGLATVDALGCAANPTLANPDASGCRQSFGTNAGGGTGQFSAPTGCTMWRSETDVLDAQVGTPRMAQDLAGNPCNAGTQECSGAHRIDVRVSNAPGAYNLQPQARIVDVWVCWRGNDATNANIHQSHARRVMAPGLR